MVHCWGGAWNKGAEPSIEKDLGIIPGFHYFSTEQEKDDFIAKLNNPIYKKHGLVWTTQEGEFTHKRTVFVGVFVYKGEEFILHDDFGYEYPEDSAIFMYTTGNYGCDCNRSLFIRNQHGEDAMPELPCGCEIELKDYGFVYLD